ncbi:hypothetical protein CVT26_002345 [Gymnopilus dilepis]|uniref:Integral membrane protein n=1 Tax=Gymnopilus dilepis TaxID=231916 RepID=A0A409Y3I6_9AGAR|nr:hypothetical protein CVT26_002345 [Gymnopilus dilepis]
MSNTTPSWPSLYNPALEIVGIAHRSPIQPGAAYLEHAHDIFRFTLYWILIFYTPPFLICGSYAFWNYAFPPSIQRSPPEAYPLSFMVPNPRFSSDAPRTQPTKLPRTNERRSRVAFALIVLFTFLTLSLAGAVIASAIMGFIVAGLYKAGNFHMSTWIPFLLAIIQVIVGMLSLWPSIVELI